MSCSQKRTSTGPESNEPTPAYAHCSLPEESDVTMNDGEESSSNIETRGRSEDWVAKTGGLRLDSPSLSTYAQLLHTATPFPEEKIPSNSLPSYPVNFYFYIIHVFCFLLIQDLF